MEDIVATWKRLRRLIDEALEEALKELGEASLVDASRYVIEGGKRFRGFLTLIVSRELGGSIEEALDAAVAVELVHAASLALDDVIDADIYRRGKASAWVQLGISKAIMTANLLVPYAQRIVYERYGHYALERTVEAWLATSRGEALDAFGGNNSDYMTIIRLKTGALFRLAAELGAIAARGDDGLVKAAGEYGEALGIAYQVADDTVDLALGLNTPGSRMLAEWLGTRSVEKAVEEAYRAAIHASTLGEKLVGRTSILSEIPIFMVKAMLGEAGLS